MQGEIKVDVGVWGGLVPENAGDHSVLRGMLDAGALGFKSFMIASGQPCQQLQPCYDEDIYLSTHTHLEVQEWGATAGDAKGSVSTNC